MRVADIRREMVNTSEPEREQLIVLTALALVGEKDDVLFGGVGVAAVLLLAFRSESVCLGLRLTSAVRVSTTVLLHVCSLFKHVLVLEGHLLWCAGNDEDIGKSAWA